MVKPRSKINVAVIISAVGIIFVSYWIVNGCAIGWHSAKYQNILKSDLPTGVICVNQILNTSGRERSTYSYRAVFKGESSLLLAYLEKLGMKEVQIEKHTGAIYFKKERMKWWDPPSLAKQNIYRLFQRQCEWPADIGQNYYITQAELNDNKLYLVQFGKIESLREK